MLSFNEFLKEAAETDKKLYVDMDGVLCDFFGRWYEMLKNMGEVIDEDAWEKIKAVMRRSKEADTLLSRAIKAGGGAEKFFATLDPLPGGKKLIAHLKKNNIPFTILSSPLGEDVKGSVAGKEEWLRKHGLGDVPQIFSHEKYNWAKGNVLVDDYGVNINAWEKHDGIGIKYEDSKVDEVIKELDKYFL